MKLQTVFSVVETNSYGTTHGCPTRGFFMTQEGAKEGAVGKGWYGGDAIVCERQAIVLDDGSLLVLDENFPAPVLANVLVK